MATRTLNLPDYYDQFVDGLVTSGRFYNASEVMRAGLCLLEQQAGDDQEKLTALRALADEVFKELDAGFGTTIDRREELSEYIGRIGRNSVQNASDRTADN
jgi:antitoxin ParD1/3/4